MTDNQNNLLDVADRFAYEWGKCCKDMIPGEIFEVMMIHNFLRTIFDAGGKYYLEKYIEETNEFNERLGKQRG